MRKLPTYLLLVALGVILVVFSPWLIGLPFILGARAYDKLDRLRYPDHAVFDSRRFASKDLKYRYTVLDDTVKKLKPGMAEAEIKNLLGPPDAILPSGDWQYESRQPGWRLIDWNGGGILISFSAQHTLLKAENNHWVD